MSVEHNNKLNETEIICPSEISLDEKNTYNDSILKSLKESQYNLPTKTNVLLNSLKEFSNRYDIDDRKIMKSKKFLISFNDLITLIKFALEFQIKINNSINEYMNEISQDFINNLSYYIFSFEKIDVCKQNENCMNSNYKSYNNNIKTMNKKNNKDNKNKNEEKKSNNKIKVNNTQKNIKINKSGYLEIKSPNNRSKVNKRKENEMNNYRKNNKSVERRSMSNTYFTLDISKNDNNKKNVLNKSTEKRRKQKEKETESDLNKNKNTNSFSIFTACENLKKSNFILNQKKSRKSSCVEQNRMSNKKNTYENQYQTFGIKKRILGNNIIKPSNMANKLLQRGIKYINDFANMKEEESKKKYYS